MVVSTVQLFPPVELCLGRSYLVLVGTEAEVLDGLTAVLGATQEQGVGTGGLLKSKLVEGQGTAASGQDARAGGGGEPQGSDLDLGDLEQAVVVGDGADDNDRLLVVAVLQVGLDTRQGDGRAVDAGGKEAAQDNLVEGRVGTTCCWRVVRKRVACMVCDGQSASVGLTSQEAVQLHEQLEVRIVALGRLAVGVAHVVAVEIDTYKETKFPRQPLAQVCSERYAAALAERKSVTTSARSIQTPHLEESWQRPHIRRDRFRSSTCIQRLDNKFSLTYPS